MRILSLLLIAVIAAAAGAIARGEAVAAPAAAAVPCAGAKVGFLGPITGEAAFIGKEQLGFARYARRLDGKRVRLVELDTQLAPARAAAAAKRLHGDPAVLAVVGPAGSQEVLAVARTFGRAPALAFVSGSALRTRLTNGSIPGFFRVVPNDAAQAPSLADAVLRLAKPRAVVVVDDRTQYGRGLADDVQERLAQGGVRVTRRSVGPAQDVAALAAAVPAATDAVVVPWREAARAHAFGRALREAGRKAAFFGGDALDSRDFRLDGAYVTAFAPDVRALPGNEAFVRGYGARFVSNFGPPVYVATRAVLTAVRQACADGKATRGEVRAKLAALVLPRTVLGRPLRFTERGDAAGARFSVFRVDATGRKTLVP